MSRTRPIFEYELEEFDKLDEERKNEILEIIRLNEIIRDEIINEALAQLKRKHRCTYSAKAE